MIVYFTLDEADCVAVVDACIVDESFDHEFGTRKLVGAKVTEIIDLQVNGYVIDVSKLRDDNFNRVLDAVQTEVTVEDVEREYSEF